MKNLFKIRCLVLIVHLFFFSFSAHAQCRCFDVSTGWSNATGGPVPFSEIQWSLCGVVEYRYRTGSCGFANPATNGGFTFAVIDTTAGNDSVWISHYINGSGQFGDIHCSSETAGHAGFDFNIVGNNWQEKIDSFIDLIPNGCIIIMYSVNKPPYTTLWAQDSDLVNKFVAMGATDLRLLCDSGSPGHLPSGPYIFWTQKGNPNWHGQAVDSDYSTLLSSSFCLSTTTGIANVNQSTYFHVYPNPSKPNGIFSVSSSESGQVNFYDAIGRLINYERLSPGINAIKIDTDEGLVFYKAEMANAETINGKLILTQ
jgi:hypothetical protein